MIEEPVLRQPFDRRHGGARAGGDDDVLRREAPAVHFDFAARRQARLSIDDVDAELAELGRIVVRLDGAPRRAHRLHDRLRRDPRLLRRESEGVRVPQLMGELRACHQRLRRHAAGPEAVAAEFLALDERDLATETRAAGGGDQSGRSTADDHYIELIRHL